MSLLLLSSTAVFGEEGKDGIAKEQGRRHGKDEECVHSVGLELTGLYGVGFRSDAGRLRTMAPGRGRC
jgi:hypothetical protein